MSRPLELQYPTPATNGSRRSHRGDARSITEAECAVLEALRETAYGQVEVVVHSSRIVQITHSQKLRLTNDG